MGSSGMFDLLDCDLCGREGIVFDGHFVEGRAEYDCCLECYRNTKVRVLAKMLSDTRLESLRTVSGSGRLLDYITLFLYSPYLRSRRLRYLRCALLARDSPFRSFIYFYNGPAGNVSERLDILDIILALVA